MVILPRPIALIGLSGAGKSEVAARVAARLEVPCADVDARIEAETGMPIGELFDTRGEAAFRALETATLERAIAEGARVIACGGGIATAQASRALLARCAVVWLEVDPAEAARRLRGLGAAARPLLRGDLPARLAALHAERSAGYASLAILRVTTDGLDAERVAEVVLRGLAGEGAL